MRSGFLDLFLGSLDQLIRDPASIELSVNADGRVWIERAGATHMALVDRAPLRANEIRDLAHQIANTGKLPLTDSAPMVSTSVQYGGVTLRAQCIIPPAAAGGAVISFRLYRPRSSEEQPKHFDFLRSPEKSSEDVRRDKLLAIKSLLTRGAQTVEARKAAALGRGPTAADPDDLLKACLDMHLNVLVSGGTSTGKTELARRLLWMVPNDQRLVVIEDATELMPLQPNHVSLVASRDEKSERSAEKLLQATLRLRPDRIILGEVRGREAVTFLSAINSGHGGSFTSLHADSARKAFDKLAFLVLESGTQLNFSEVLAYLRSSIDVVIQTDREDARRGIVEIWFPAIDDASPDNNQHSRAKSRAL